MMIFTDYNKPYIIETLTGPIVPSHYWVFSGEMVDFTLSPISYLEETTGPVIEFMIEGFTFFLPTSWHIMIMDEETCQIDTVPVSSCARSNYTAFLFSPNDTKIRMGEIRVVDYHKNMPLAHPMMEKGTMLCYPIGPEKSNKGEDNILCINAGPYDLTAKFLGACTAADILF